MISPLILLAGLRLFHPDTARIVANRIVVEPIGVSVAIPDDWVDRAKRAPNLCLSNQPAAFYAPLSATRKEIANARGSWHQEYSSVADSVLPLSTAVAHFGRLDWLNPPCYGELQARIYVLSEAPQEVAQRVRTIGVPTANHFFTSSATVTDTSGWTRASISWFASYGDYGGPVSMDYYARVRDGRTVVLLFMYTTHSATRNREEVASILASWRVVTPTKGP